MPNRSKVNDSRFWQRWAAAGAIGTCSRARRLRKDAVEFLYPTARQFAFDEVCERIVRELEKRNWRVPGMSVEFGEYGSGEQKLRKVSCIKGLDFMLRFRRGQRTLPGNAWNDTAAVHEIVIPKKELHVYEEECGPTFYLYVGDNWEKDRAAFMSGCKVNSKLHKEPRLYLCYKGACTCSYTGGASFSAVAFIETMMESGFGKATQSVHTHEGRRAPLLVHDNDLGREYDPVSDEPKSFVTEEVMQEFKKYLQDVVLKMIESCPIPSRKIGFKDLADIPFPPTVGPLFCFADYDEERRIRQGQEDSSQLSLPQRYGLTGNGLRLVSLGTPVDSTVPKIAYGGFRWCGIGEVDARSDFESLEVFGRERRSSEPFLIRLKPNRANDIYIVDHEPYERRRKEIESIPSENKDFTRDELCDFVSARARTLIPIHLYRGGYKKPVVLIKRELGFDEVEVVAEAPSPRYAMA